MNRQGIEFKKTSELVCMIGCALMTSSIASAGEAGWDGMMRDAGVVVDHQPYNFGGLAADTLFRENEFLPPTWQLVADDFILAESAIIDQIRFWGYYHLNSVPVGDDHFRVRLYSPRPLDQLPGDVLYEEVFSKVSRAFTGRFIIDSGAPAEYMFSVGLSNSIHLMAESNYWLEIVQIGDQDSIFTWEFSRSGEINGQAFNNPIVQDWTHTISITSDTAFQLIAIPEPQSLLLLVVGIAIGWRRSRG